jgi:hypothetical protein
VASESEIFLRLTIPEPTVILGQELLPLSIGHLLYLDRLGLSPPTEPADLLSAILICTRTVDDVLPTLQDRWLELKIRVWLFRVSPFRKIDWDDAMEKFANHIEAGTDAPSAISLHDSGGSINESGTPFLQHMKATLQSRLNYTPAEAINCSFAQAIWDYYSWHESEGNVRVADREKRAAMKARADADHESLIAEAIAIKNNGGGCNAI